MSTFILADCPLNILQKTYSGLTKLELLKTLLQSLYLNWFHSQKDEFFPHVFQSNIHTNNSFAAFAESGNSTHGLSFCKSLKATACSNLFASLKQVLAFRRFLQKSDLVLEYSGIRQVNETASVILQDCYSE